MMLDINKPRKTCAWCNGTGKQSTRFEIGAGGSCMFCSGTGEDTLKVADVQPPKREPPPEPLGPPRPPSLNYDADNPPAACVCPTCKNACTERVGFFLPGEAENVAEFKGITLPELFENFLTVDHHNGVFVLAPAWRPNRNNDADTGGMAPYDKKGVCIFHNADGLCDIHDVKPFECHALSHDTYKVVMERHDAVANAWLPDKHQQQLRDLAGYLYETDDPRDYWDD